MRSVGDSEGPKALVLGIGPHEVGMDHESAGLGRDQTNCRFSNTILPLGTNTAEANVLMIGMNLISEGLAFVDAIVSVVGFNGDTQFMTSSFKTDLSVDGVGCVESDLMFNVHVARSGVAEDSGATEFVGVLFFSCSVEQPTSDSRFKLVTEDELTREKFVLSERSNLVLFLSGDSVAIRLAHLSSLLARGTKGVLSRVGFTEAKSFSIQISTGGQREHMAEREVP